MTDNNIYDLAIVGGGPAGLTASIYTSRYKVKNVVVSEFMGGLMFEATEVGNFPSYPEISGAELSQKMQDHAFKSLGADAVFGRVANIDKNEDETFTLLLENDTEITAKSVIITSGTKHNKLNIPGEKEFAGKGVSYCATCDAFFYRDKVAAVAGGGNAALTAALHLAKVAKKVYLIHRRDEFRGEKIWLEKAQNTENIEMLLNTNIAQIVGQERIEKLILDDNKELPIDGLFISIGTTPTLNFTSNFKIDLDDKAHIQVNAYMATNIDGVFAAGDVTNGSNYFKQIATAVGEGSVAANAAYQWLQKHSGKKGEKVDYS